MDENDLIAYITGNCVSDVTRDCVIEFSSTLCGWFEDCSKFRSFVEDYKDKIRKKYREASTLNSTPNSTLEKLKDFLFELRVALILLLDSRFEVEYEKDCPDNTCRPDFFVTFNQTIKFYVEVTRIREGELVADFRGCVKKITDRIQKKPSSLVYDLDTGTQNADEKFVERFKSSEDEIVCFIEDKISSEENKLSPGAKRKFSVPGFQDMELVLTKLACKSKEGAYLTYVKFGIPFTNKEYYKLGDTIFKMLRQTCPNMINIGVIDTDSITHNNLTLTSATLKTSGISI